MKAPGAMSRRMALVSVPPAFRRGRREAKQRLDRSSRVVPLRDPGIVTESEYKTKIIDLQSFSVAPRLRFHRVCAHVRDKLRSGATKKMWRPRGRRKEGRRGVNRYGKTEENRWRRDERPRFDRVEGRTGIPVTGAGNDRTTRSPAISPPCMREQGMVLSPLPLPHASNPGYGGPAPRRDPRFEVLEKVAHPCAEPLKLRPLAAHPVARTAERNRLPQALGQRQAGMDVERGHGARTQGKSASLFNR